jgi:predicted TIM-barrel fold metal-dependent hydrolase
MAIFFDAFTCYGPRPGAHRHHPWTLAHLRDELAHCSISGALVACTMQVNHDCMHENLRLCEAIGGNDRLFPIWNVIPHWTDEFPEPAELTGLMRKHDVRAVTMHPGENGFSLVSETTAPLLTGLERSETLVIFNHCDAGNLDQVEEIARRHPKLPLLINNTRWNLQRTLWPLLLRFKNLHTSFTEMQANRGLEWLVANGCEDQLVFASNAPEMSAGAHRAYIDWSELPDATKEKVASGNLVRLLKGLCPPREVVNTQEDEIMAESRRGEPLSCLTIDMHAHMLHEGMHGAGGPHTMYDGGPEGVHRLARQMGVDAMGIMSWAAIAGCDAEQGNLQVREALDRHPDFYWGLGTFDVIHKSADEMRAEMEVLYEDERFVGLKPYPTYGIPYNDTRYDCWWQFGNERGLYTGIHPYHWWKPEEFEHICEQAPNLTVVAFHCGTSYEVADQAIELARKHSNVMIEPTLTPVCCGIIDYLVQGAGEDRVMYGSDLPMRDPRQQLGWIVYSRLGVDAKKKVLGANALRLLEKVKWPGVARLQDRVLTHA